ncbi:hypothetical protein [Agrococcus jejuensis]|uniref:Uncharacterized protein n=1 Tax=Agrococcus jejuensis TaxID=399736 RepID=A0A1G8EM22_9MICO|nr:hypothetical protein [Agrococcus jejuensis]SDH70917.1 hypothetical protein SAMN04489720_2099 [Agrococcus jejuensis]
MTTARGRACERLRADLLRRPATAWEVLADVVRVAGVVSIVVAGVGGGATDAAVLLLAASASLLPRMLGLRGGLDAGFGLVVLVAAWSGVLDLYTSIAWWDVAVHVVCTGVVSIVALVVLARAGAIAPPRSSSTWMPVVLATTVGLALSALWEIVEWLGHTLVDSQIFVAYDDTIGDVVAGGVGALLGGVVAGLVRLERVRADAGRAP